MFLIDVSRSQSRLSQSRDQL